MKVDKEFILELRARARLWCGGYKHVMEIQTWDRGNGPEIDIAGFSEEDCDKSDISHIDVVLGLELPDNADQIDIAVFGVEFKGGDKDIDSTKLGYFYIQTKDGKLTNESWQ